MIKIKRIYEEINDNDGNRILIERLWPRGFTKERAAITYWAKELAPSTELRKWFGHDIGKWNEFQCKYKQEIQLNLKYLNEIKLKYGHGNLTLVYSASDIDHNSAVILCPYFL